LVSFAGAARGFSGEQFQRVAARQSAEAFASRRFQFGLDALHGAADGQRQSRPTAYQAAKDAWGEEAAP
jgi:hypothetical protein